MKPVEGAGEGGLPLRDDLQDVEDELHDDGAFAELTGASVDDGDEGAVQVAQVLRQQGLAVTARQVAHLNQAHQRSEEHTSELQSR